MSHWLKSLPGSARDAIRAELNSVDVLANQCWISPDEVRSHYAPIAIWQAACCSMGVFDAIFLGSALVFALTAAMVVTMVGFLRRCVELIDGLKKLDGTRRRLAEAGMSDNYIDALELHFLMDLYDAGVR